MLNIVIFEKPNGEVQPDTFYCLTRFQGQITKEISNFAKGGNLTA